MTSRSSLNAAAVLGGLILSTLVSCKSVRTEKWTTKWDPLREKYASNFKIEKDDEGTPRAVKIDRDGNPIDPEEAELALGRKSFNGRKSQFDRKNYDKKKFTHRMFRKDEYQRDSFRFIKDRNKAIEASADAGKLFADSDLTARDSNRVVRDSNKNAARRGFFRGNKKKMYDSPAFIDARKSQEKNRQPHGSEPKSLTTVTPPTFEDIREILGRPL